MVVIDGTELADDGALTAQVSELGGKAATALEAAHIGEWDVDLQTREIVLSPQSRSLLGLPKRGQVTLDDIETRRHPDGRATADFLRRNILSDPGKGFIRQSYRFQLPDGASRWLELRGTIFRDPTGRPVRILGVLLDVTEQEARIQMLEQNWRRFEAALANTAIVLFEHDMDLRYTWCHNPPLGFEAYQIVGKTDSDLMGPKLAAPIEAKKRQVLASGRAMQTEVVVPGQQGDELYDLHIEPLRNDRGDVVGLACAAIALGPAVPQGAKRRSRPAATPYRTVQDRDVLLDRISARLDARQRDRGLIPVSINVFERRLDGLLPLSPDDRLRLASLEVHSRYIAGKELLDFATDDTGSPWLVGNGWVYSYDLFVDGRRQIIRFHLPGDLISLGGQRGATSEHLYATASDCVLCSLDPGALSQMSLGADTLGQALRRAAAQDAAITEQHLVSIGRRSAEARLAHLLLELGGRLEVVQLADADGYRCPLTQELIADALGLTNVHVNRLLRRLRDQGLLTFVRGFVAFKDKPRLIKLAEYDPAFLGRLPD